MKVVKFGGSSLSNRRQFQKVKQIIESDDERAVIVVSALGKSNVTDDKLTDLLYVIHASIEHHMDWAPLWHVFCSRFLEIRETLSIDFPMESFLEEIYQTFCTTKVSKDFIVSRGEYLTAQLMAAYLGATFIDAKELIYFDYTGAIDFEKTEQAVQPFLKEEKIVVPGFYGVNPMGKEKLMTRGGSDITGAILARSMHAAVYENWTDVSGLMMADPRIVENPQVIEEISFRELRELSYMGATVLHEAAILPVQEVDIPIHILNTNEPQARGTRISKEEIPKKTGITGIAGRKDFLSITLFKRHMSEEIGFIWKAMSIFAKHGVSIEHIPSGIDNIGVIVAKEAIEEVLFLITEELKESLGVEEISIVEDLALIAVVGSSMDDSIGISGRVLPILNALSIRTSILSQGAQGLNLIIGVANHEYEEVIEGIYQGVVVTDVSNIQKRVTSNT
ncbi:MAG: aspartate kinase [Enterococcus sp.]